MRGAIMKKKIITLILCIVSIFAVIISVNFQYADANNSYYSSVEGLEGEELLNALADLTQAKHTNYNTYGEVRYMYEADQDPNNSSNVLDFYSQISVAGAWDGGSTWNREHVWPKALSGGLYTNTDNSDRGAGADIHHLRPTIPNINSSRQDKRYTDFDYIEQNGVENKFNGVLVAYDSTGLWEPLDNVKGDAARILMYLYMHYSTEVEANADFSYAGNLDITNVFYTDEETDETTDDTTEEAANDATTEEVADAPAETPKKKKA
jgi:endonuclease I